MLTQVSQVPEQFADRGAKSSFTLPADTFVHTDPTATITLSADLADGQKLPNWIRFDPNSGVFVFEAPSDFVGELKIKVTARDAKGNEVSTLFRFHVGQKKDAPFGAKGRASLSEQLRYAGRDRGSIYAQEANRMAAASTVHQVSRT